MLGPFTREMEKSTRMEMTGAIPVISIRVDSCFFDCVALLGRVHLERPVRSVVASGAADRAVADIAGVGRGAEGHDDLQSVMSVGAAMDAVAVGHLDGAAIDVA